MSTTQRRERQRAKKPKVKTGCITCKIRRVKCDETRPECLRCQKFGPRYCDGYEDQRMQVNDVRVILPRGQHYVYGVPAPRRAPELQAFENEDEFRCFQLYCEDVAPQLSASNTSIWHRILLQTGQNFPFIRNAIISIGALTHSMKYVHPGKTHVPGVDKPSRIMPNPDQVRSLARYHSFALEHYDKFLQGASRAHLSLMTKDHARRMTMIACLLVVCMENIQYHYQNAVTHAQKGLQVMRALRNSGVDSVIKSPVPDIVEDELIHQFHRMELSVMTLYDARIPSVHSQLKEDGDMAVRNMPHTFTQLEVASKYLILIMRRTYHFIANALVDKSPYTKFTDQAKTVLNPNSNLATDFTTWLRDAPDELQVEQEKYAAENRRWAQAFQPLLCSANNNYNQQDSVRLLLLKLHSVTLTVRLAGHLSKTELIYDNFMAEFQKIVDLATTILNHPHADSVFAGGAFNFDMCIVYPVVTAGLFCRDRKLRREAISLLAKKDWREAQFSSKTSAAVAIFVMECEEDGVETDYIPEWARGRLSGIDADLESRVMKLQCIRGVGEFATRIERTVYC